MPPIPREKWSEAARQAEADAAFHRGYTTALLESYGKDIEEIKARDAACVARRETNEGEAFRRLRKLETRGQGGEAGGTGGFPGVLGKVTWSLTGKISMAIVATGLAVGGCIYVARSGKSPDLAPIANLKSKIENPEAQP